IYECRAGQNGAFEWTLRAPEATLYDKGGAKAGTHYAGPTWQLDDGSTIVGKKAASAPSPAGSIPWLRLVASGHGPVDGRLKTATSVQRLATTGGVAPAEGCDARAAGSEARVPYTADYFFYQTTNGDRSPPVQCR